MLAGVHRSDPADRAGLTRRTLLAGGIALGAVALAAAGCTSSPDDSSGGSPSPVDPDPDASVRQAVAEAEAAIIALYDAAIAAYPALAADLGAVRDEHRAHAEAMGIAVASPSPSPPAPATRSAALAGLAEAERAAVLERTAACEASTGADLARVTALIAASEAGHVEFLRGIA